MTSMEENWLGESIEFRLVNRLCRLCYGRLAPPTYGRAKVTSRRRNGAKSFEIELRKALRRPSDLDLLLGLDPEDDDEDIKEAQELLCDLCVVFDSLSSHHPPVWDSFLNSRQGKGMKYPKFRALLVHLEGSDTGQQIEAVSGHDANPAWRLFALLSEAHMEKTSRVLKRFNVFLDQLSLSKAEVDDLAGAAVTEPPPQPPHQNPVGGGIRNRFRHAEAAIKAIFSRLSKCEHNATKAHDILIQLPAVRDIISQDNRSPDSDLELFLSACADSSQWQEAQVVHKSNRCDSTESSICDAIKEALFLSGGLEFHIQDQLTDISENDFLIPSYDYVKPRHGRLKPCKTLWDLLDSGTLSRVRLATHFLSTTEVRLISADERRELAIQLLYGLVMCLRYGCTIATWDSKRVFVLADADGRQHAVATFPHVSCVEGDPKAKWFDLPDLEVSLERAPTPKAFIKMAKALLEIGYGQCLDRLEVNASGDNQELSKNLRKMVQNMRLEVDESGSGGGDPRLKNWTNSLDVFPYIAAAESCLRFSFLYRKEVNRIGMGRERIDPWPIVENIIYNQIMCKLEKTDLMDSPIGSMESVQEARSRSQERPVAGLKTKSRAYVIRGAVVDAHPGRQNVVRLFDGSRISGDHALASQAERFFADLEAFRAAFESYVDDDVNSITPPRPVRIAILDTGIDKDNVEIDFDGEHMKDDWCVNFVGGPLNPSGAPDPFAFHDHDGHGTHCASLLRKVAPDAEIYVAKVFGKNEFDLTQARNISKAIKHSVQTWDVDIISMSFGLDSPTSEASMCEWRSIRKEIEEQITLARPRLLFAAASNDGKNRPRAFPSTHRDVFCVHASDGNGNGCGLNPHHDGADNNLMTLGTGIRLLEDDSYVYGEGTSLATAIAAGMAASIMELTSRMSRLNERTRTALRTSEGMRKLLLRRMSGPGDSGKPRPYVAPWNYWRPEYWTSNPDGLEMVWSQLNCDFIDYY
ncbi:hypothetical protein MAPG_08397 [Magnaporthiopsis poae ATCC 64411]|uniref:Uncharacterized protein n=1 Tax=Magnaporthiopsis poae (strain ATCC 64411 / 73-15) TaxID=644358 RepID=A0A0C4E793_MAGP6|nr:hypothetical protein MAPG_08397 [Magnaporthiopsis poae ATCC 64411]